MSNVIGQSKLVFNKLYKASYAQKVRFDENLSFADDTLYLAEYLLYSKRCVVTTKPLYHYYFNRSGNATSEKLCGKSSDFVRATKLLYDLLNENMATDIGVECCVDTIIRIAEQMTAKRKCSEYIKAVRQLTNYISPIYHPIKVHCCLRKKGSCSYQKFS